MFLNYVKKKLLLKHKFLQQKLTYTNYKKVREALVFIIWFKQYFIEINYIQIPFHKQVHTIYDSEKDPEESLRLI